MLTTPEERKGALSEILLFSIYKIVQKVPLSRMQEPVLEAHKLGQAMCQTWLVNICRPSQIHLYF